MSNEYKRYQEGVIRSILARPDELMNIIDFVDSSDFEDVNFKTVYEAMLDIYVQRKPISLPEIALRIGEKGGAINPGWLFNLESNISQWVQMAPPSTWAKLLKRESSKQKAIEVLKDGINNMNDASVNPLESMDSISTKLTDVSISATSGDKFNIKDAIENFKEDTLKIQQTEGRIAAINSAYPTIDSYTQGWAPTHLITVGARTGIGKSVFAINNAIAAMQQGKSVLFFSLEMTEREVISRMVSSMAMIPIQKIEKAEALTDDEKQREEEALNFIANSKLNIETEPHVTIEFLKRVSIKQAQSEEGLDFIIIDYLQLIENSGKQNRQEAVSEVSRSVKILAKTLNVPVMVLVQVNRERREEEGDQPPKLYDIRESGAIAQDSNVVILIHRNMEEDAETIDPKALFIIAKNRQGESNKFLSVRTRLECSLFIDDGERGLKHIQDQQLASEFMDSQSNNNFGNQENHGFTGQFTEEEQNMFKGEEGFGSDYVENNIHDNSLENLNFESVESDVPENKENNIENVGFSKEQEQYSTSFSTDDNFPENEQYYQDIQSMIGDYTKEPDDYEFGSEDDTF